MLRLNRIALIPAFCAIVLTSMAGCETMNNAERGAVVGGAGGAGLGAMIGHHVGNAGAGALLGGATGALLGGAMGEAEDNAQERDLHAAHAAHMEATREFERHAMTNHDVVKLSQNSMSDNTIIDAIRRRGGRFDLSTDGLIELHDHGVSEHVISYMQHHATY